MTDDIDIDCVPAWICHDGAGHRYAVVHPDLVDQHPDQPNDEVPPLARLLPVTDSGGNWLPGER